MKSQQRPLVDYHDGLLSLSKVVAWLSEMGDRKENSMLDALAAATTTPPSASMTIEIIQVAMMEMAFVPVVNNFICPGWERMPSVWKKSIDKMGRCFRSSWKRKLPYFIQSLSSGLPTCRDCCNYCYYFMMSPFSDLRCVEGVTRTLHLSRIGSRGL